MNTMDEDMSSLKKIHTNPVDMLINMMTDDKHQSCIKMMRLTKF